MTARHKPLLVVDDDPYNRDMLTRRLNRAGFATEEAANAQAALQALEASDIDLVLLDSMMPGMNGVDLLRLLRATRSAEELPVIMVTAFSDSAHVVEALSLGANDYITKPVDFSIAVARIEAQLKRKRAEEALRESEERYWLAALGANDGLWDWDLVRDTVYYSARWKEVLGLKEDEVGTSPKDWFDRLHPEDAPRVRVELDGLWTTPQAVQYASEQRLRHADDSYRWVLVRGHLLRDSGGKPTRIAGSFTDITGSKAFDSVTGLPNRTMLIERLCLRLDEIRDDPTQVAALLFLDIDRFKVINDSLGHDVGDQLLAGFADRLESLTRVNLDAPPKRRDLIARLGGDEFAVLLAEMRRPEDASIVAERILATLEEPFQIEGREVFASASIGIAVADQAYRHTSELMRDADTAMHRAKVLGRGRYEVFRSQMRDAALSRLETEQDLRLGLERGQVVAYYQPKVCLLSGRVLGFEALARWQHPTRGIISPGEFIPIAEETGLIFELGKSVLHQACRQMQDWHRRFPSEPAMEIAVNLSPRQFRHPDIVGVVAAVLEESGLMAGTLKLEITESVLIDEPDRAIQVLYALKKLGVGLKLDDFGTGYSSMSYLARLPCDSLKIDRSFIRRMGDDEASLQVVKAILNLAGNLGMHVVAEGIETETQMLQLRELGCEFGQGFFYAAPLPPQEAECYLAGMLVETPCGAGQANE